MLAQYYNSDSESDAEDDVGENSNSNPMSSSFSGAKADKSSDDVIDDKPVPPGIVCPPEEQRIIIDKTAAYVLKNGKDFEEILRTKNDQRFTFLQYTDPYHKYYIYKVTGAVCADVANVKLSRCQERITSASIGNRGRSELKRTEAPKPISEL